MIEVIADNIISPLGNNSDANLRAILTGRSEIKAHQDYFDMPEPFCASLLHRGYISSKAHEIGADNHYSFFEQLCILSAYWALEETGIEPTEKDVVFILSTTKGNVDHLQEDCKDSSCYLGETADKIAGYFRNPNTPVVVSNACISGVSAQIAAVRLLLARQFKTAVVIGADVLSKFIISGFQSFKALSPAPCRPYDAERVGLNLGEAAGTMILRHTETPVDNWRYMASSIHNDANHISGPSRTGEGVYRVLSDLQKTISIDNLAFINTHGTATAYNDEMESIAIHRAGLEEVALCGLKGFFGHTLGAAGIIETILSMKAIDNGLVLPTRGFNLQGTTYPLNLSNTSRPTNKSSFIKILSGFGGSNAGIAYGKGGV